MRRYAKRFSRKLSNDSQRLATYAQAVIEAASRLEERAWEAELDGLLLKLLKSGHQDTVDAALEHTFGQQSAAYDALMESLEAVSESCVIEHEGKQYDALLIAAPMLAWTRFSIASGPISADAAATAAAHLYAHILAPDARLAVAPALYAIDQLPRTHAETLSLTQHLAQAALRGTSWRVPSNAPETAPFLADTRYLLATAVVPRGQAVFAWQAAGDPQGRDAALSQWKTQMQANAARLLPGCGVELLLPEAYYVACREGDKRVRPASVRAAVHYLTHALNVEPNGLHAIIGGFGEDGPDARVDEYRVGFALADSRDVVYGLVWPLFGPEDGELPEDSLPDTLLEDDRLTPLQEITRLLRDAGVTRIKRHAGLFPMESCDDCGAPLYLDLEAELVHAQMPEDVPQPAGHFH